MAHSGISLALAAVVAAHAMALPAYGSEHPLPDGESAESAMPTGGARAPVTEAPAAGGEATVPPSKPSAEAAGPAPTQQAPVTDQPGARAQQAPDDDPPGDDAPDAKEEEQSEIVIPVPPADVPPQPERPVAGARPELPATGSHHLLLALGGLVLILSGAAVRTATRA